MLFPVIKHNPGTKISNVLMVETEKNTFGHFWRRVISSGL
jgi:hypothetical protein